jgi:hypothetical protein
MRDLLQGGHELAIYAPPKPPSTTAARNSDIHISAGESLTASTGCGMGCSTLYLTVKVSISDKELQPVRARPSRLTPNSCSAQLAPADAISRGPGAPYQRYRHPAAPLSGPQPPRFFDSAGMSAGPEILTQWGYRLPGTNDSQLAYQIRISAMSAGYTLCSRCDDVRSR